MQEKSQNPFVSFYTEHNISPVHQDISNFSQHMKRREKLYRSLGLPPFTFNKETVLEIGPGGGYNALVFFKWGAKVDFVEPNKTAQNELPVLLGQEDINPHEWNLFSGLIEEFDPEKGYNVVIAEGFIPGLYERQSVIAKISKVVNVGGVVVVTCVDDISFFFDHLKRIVAARLVSNISNFEEKVSVLVEAFASHLDTLKYASRPVEDWVIDTFLNPAIYGNWFSIAECIEEFGSEFEVLGSSPRMFTDYSWYKNVNIDTNAVLLEQFQAKRHMLFFQHLEEEVGDKVLNQKLLESCFNVRNLVKECKEDYSQDNVNKIVEAIKDVRTATIGFDLRITDAIDEAISLLLDTELTTAKISGATHLIAACGRTMQYVSLVKKFSK